MTEIERKNHYSLQINNGVNYLRYNAYCAADTDIIKVCKHVAAAVELLDTLNKESDTENADIVGDLAALAQLAQSINKPKIQHYER